MATPNTRKELEVMRRENPLAYNSVVQRQEEAHRETRISQEIRALYPGHGDAVVIKMKASGQILRIGFENALAALMRGDAELVKPAAVHENAMLRGGESRGVTVL